MSLCENITLIADNVNSNCNNENTMQISTECPIVCLTSILWMYNNCMEFMLENTDIKQTFKYLIEWCYYKKNIIN